MNRTTELNEMKKRLSEVVARHDRFKNAYFFRPNSTASGRRSAERRNNDRYENERYGIYAENDYRESCNHVYYRGHFQIGEKSVTVAAIRKIIDALNYVC